MHEFRLQDSSPASFAAMTDTPFPSGPWTGFLNYCAGGRRYRVDLLLSFEQGTISGEGTDRVGPSLVSGRYDVESCECWWIKTYIGAHHVTYRGYREGKGMWGTWEIGTGWRGGFHIWPLGDEPEDELHAAIEQSTPAQPAWTER
jgi:hypothetical protein